MLMKNLVIINSFLIFGIVICQEHLTRKSELSDICASKRSCKSCITAKANCAWCSQKNYSEYRCHGYNNLISLGCKKEKIVFFHSSETLVKNDDVGPVNGTSVQIKPQRVKLKLRPKEEHTMKVYFRLDSGYPVDLYYLMDLSHTMMDDKQKLIELGDSLATYMKSISRSFRIGFGSFVDKTVIPFLRYHGNLDIGGACEECAPQYGFCNYMSLEDNVTRFIEEVTNSKISGNVDDLEGGLDAMMQVIVCENELGWRNYSRKMIVFTTDAKSHMAGDGKLLGIVAPNDARCHLDSKGYYTETETMDYPSMGQLNRVLQEKKFNVIFAIRNESIDFYKNMSSFLEGSAYGELAEDSSNVVELIQNHFININSVVEMKAIAPSNVKVQFESTCMGGPLKQTSVCNDIKANTLIPFNVTISASYCLNISGPQTIEIYPVGIQEKLAIELELICDCECSKPKNVKVNSSLCNYQGDLECGICKCNNNKYGDFCECDGDLVSDKEELENCIKPGANTVCNNRGKCKCGKCDCLQSSASEMWGQYCECDNLACLKVAGKLCAGNGDCVCGECKCYGNFTGEVCNCLMSTESCLAKNGKVCNDQGECNCGKCACFEADVKHKYSGPTCEECLTCLEPCQKLKPCVQCQIFKSGPLTKEDCLSKCNFTIDIVQVLQEESSDIKHCKSKDDDDCTFMFSHTLTSPREVKVKEKKSCPEPLASYIIITSIIGFIVLVSVILLVIWKCFTHFIDAKEYAKFKKEREKAMWTNSENPLYKQPCSIYKNPMYDIKEKSL